MASRRAAVPAKHLFNGFRPSPSSPSPWLSRSMATQAPPPEQVVRQAYADASMSSTATEPLLQDNHTIPPSSQQPALRRAPRFVAQPNPFLTTTQCTLHAFPSFEPTRFAEYPSTHLCVPLRKDILHRAVVFEGDNTRQGTASTLWRSEVHGSNRKIRPQKGTGSARLGDKKSPMLKGGGVAFGPKPRDFGTDLPQKVYDLAWRVALSYRYSQGELLLIDGEAEIDVAEASRERFMKDLLLYNKMGNSHGRTLFITEKPREALFAGLQGLPQHARAKDVEDVDVKDLLGMGRLVVERRALDRILQEHERDLQANVQLHSWEGFARKRGRTVSGATV